MREEGVNFPCGDLTLEGVLTIPEGDGPFPSVTICHPHPFIGEAWTIMGLRGL